MAIKIHLSDITMRGSSGILNGSEISECEDTEIEIHRAYLERQSQILCNEKIGQYHAQRENSNQEKTQADGFVKGILVNVISDLIGKVF